jgi:hypothetical protein
MNEMKSKTLFFSDVYVNYTLDRQRREVTRCTRQVSKMLRLPSSTYAENSV